MPLRPLLVGAALLVGPCTALGAGWTPPGPLAPADGAVTGPPSVALVADGRAMTAWVGGSTRGDGRGARVRVAERVSTTAAWTRPRTLSGAGASDAVVSLDDAGRGVVAWVAAGRVVGAVREGPRMPWRRRPVAEVGGPVETIAAALDRAGRATVVWAERADGGFVVRLASRLSPSDAWSVRPPRLVVAGSVAPAIALGAGSGALVAWREDGRVRVSRTAGGAFETPTDVAGDGVGPVAVAMAPRGAGLIAWSVRLPGGTPVMIAAGRGAGAERWGAAEDLGIGAGPVAAVDDRGDAVVAWAATSPSGAQGIEAATRRRGAAWAASTVVPLAACDCTLTPRAAAVRAGSALVSWSRTGGGRGSGGGAALVPGSSRWQRAPGVASRPGVAPALALGPGGRGLAVWAGVTPGGGLRWASIGDG